ncbi:16S rRNA (adenine(1518)-N(6)/adenine(1519)-N(6))-dimethyltransferase RsmA [Ichthyobacterium seriolicida]|uniref:Ribosomal RNA small subunit methyltransferase A n=1 Tax=Ichthyobacterium seriolicida TaxID=242600 RepID=A0A1J1DY52_9FLAO|nr:16S rRNA (adenine(1518)-N(6)/adenine(1519)-N(6))-dimethyltransferase RsmA [Ichthyobacterium seriolicida]BAV94785.1 dimethyladenosine transferase [Ichthyobacterium seriolicida]
MKYIKAKKYLGQHFLKDDTIAEKIVNSMSFCNYKKVIEVGAGMGVMTKYLLQRDVNLYVIELDVESVEYLTEKYESLVANIFNEDFLKFNLNDISKGEDFGLIGNYPYNISSQILFKLLEYKSQIPEMCGMFQKEVADRVVSKHGNKTYGILSVLIQAFYHVEYLFTVEPDSFYPIPKVRSAVIRLKRKENNKINCNEKLLFKVVKMSFNHRRKKLKNNLKPLFLSDALQTCIFADKRCEQLSVEDFITLTKIVEEDNPTILDSN